VLRNGPGPTAMVRTDMDALPIVENTGVPYASKVRVKRADGSEVGVMHACGHDVHMAVFRRHGAGAGTNERPMERHVNPNWSARGGSDWRSECAASRRVLDEVSKTTVRSRIARYKRRAYRQGCVACGNDVGWRRLG